MNFQGSLLDDGSDVSLGSLSSIRRHRLAFGAWVDLLPGWLVGADELFMRLRDTVPWRAEKREMFDSVVDVPRLLCAYAKGEPLPDPGLTLARDALSQYYAAELGEEFATAGLCYYRDGRDSVAWHGDRIGRGRDHDTIVAIISLGSPRKLSLRPGQYGLGQYGLGQYGLGEYGSGQHELSQYAPDQHGLGESDSELQAQPQGTARPLGFEVGHGDLLVMGGSCQRTWDHAITKTAKAVGPRISVQFRPLNVL